MVNSVQNFIYRFFLNPEYRIYRHIVLLCVVIMITLSMGFVEKDNISQRILLQTGYTIVILTVFYTNIYYAVPRYLLTNRIGKYMLYMGFAILLTIVIVITVQALVYVDFTEELKQLQLISLYVNLSVSVVNVGVVLMGITTIMLFRHWIVSHLRAGELQATALETELIFLKSQINPHFLFNMLNNVNVLIRKDGKEASHVIFKLEELLRYQIKESEKEYVSLSSEISFLTDYLKLEQLRRDGFQFFVFHTVLGKEMQLPPLLFIPFVENAVKYSQDSEDQSHVYLSFYVEENQLLFLCINSKPAREIKKSKTGGLGLVNIQRRLELLYPNNHQLEIKDEQKYYTIKMIIPL